MYTGDKMQFTLTQASYSPCSTSRLSPTNLSVTSSMRSFIISDGTGDEVQEERLLS